MTTIPREIATFGPAEATEAIQQAIDRAAESDDAVVLVPPGVFTIRTIFLRSRVTLHLAAGAVLTPDLDLDAYPKLAHGHNKDRQPYHLIVAQELDDVSIRGAGVIDGNGEEFWDKPTEPSPFFVQTARRISPMIEIAGCCNVMVEGVTLRRSPGWTLHLYNCDRVRIEGVSVENHLYGPNTDGFDINGCRDVFVSGCRLAACDDTIIVKATEDARSCEHVTVTNCVLESNCAALGIGAETRSGIRHVAFSNCTVRNALRLFQIIMWDGGEVENVVVSNITGRALTAGGTDRVIHLDLQEHRRQNPDLGTMRNIQFSNIVCETRGRILMTAQDGARLENISLRDIRLDYPEVEDPAETVPRSKSTQLSNFSPAARSARAAVVADNIKNLALSNVAATWPAECSVPMHGLWARNVENAVIDCPLLEPSVAGVEPWLMENCTFR